MSAIIQTMAAYGSIERGVPWNSADKSASTVLSASDYIATKSGGAGESGVRTTQPASPERGHKTRVEFKALVVASANQHYGIATSTHPFTQYLGANVESFGASGSSGFGYYDGYVYYANGIALANNDVLEMEFDDIFAWFRKNGAGNWNNDGAANPATGVGGFRHFMPSGSDIYPSLRMYDNTCSIEIRTEADTYSYAASSGFLGIPIIKQSNSGSLGNVWNVSDKSADVTLSGRYRQAHSTSSSEKGVRTVNGVTTGSALKKYFEIKSFGSTGNDHWGIATASHSFANAIGFNAHSTGASVGGTVYHNSSGFANTGFTISAGDYMQIAVDDTSIWFRKNNTGNWNNSGTADPASNVGGFAHSLSGTWFPCIRIYDDQSRLIINLASTDWLGTCPSGFSEI